MAKFPEYFYFRVKLNPIGMEIILEDASDIDVAEVVRCANCLYRTKRGRCRAWSRFGTVNTTGSGFCYKGKPKKSVGGADANT